MALLTVRSAPALLLHRSQDRPNENSHEAGQDEDPPLLPFTRQLVLDRRDDIFHKVLGDMVPKER